MTTSSSAPARNPGVDVRRAADRFATDIGWLDSKHSFSFGHHYDPRQHRPRPAAREQRRHRPRRHRLRHPPAPRHGDRHLGAVGRTRAQGLREATAACSTRASPSACRPARGIWHSEMNNSGTRRRALRPDVGHARHRVDRPRLRAARHQRRARPRAAWSRSPPARATTRPSRSARRGAVLYGGRLRAGRDRHGARRPPRPRLRPASARRTLQSAGVLGVG